MQMEVTKEFRFEAHHKLPWHNGKCARDHGHSYVLQVSVRGRMKASRGETDSGMVMDFADISAVVKPLVESKLDHHSLNDFLENPTAELTVSWLVHELRTHLPELSRVRLYETATSYVEWQASWPA